MAASKSEIAHWFDTGKKDGATHMIVVCDTYDWEDFPVYVYQGENVRDIVNNHTGVNMQKVMEVYSLKKDKNVQLSSYRVFYLD